MTQASEPGFYDSQRYRHYWVLDAFEQAEKNNNQESRCFQILMTYDHDVLHTFRGSNLNQSIN